jgi:hypothetical protein
MERDDDVDSGDDNNNNSDKNNYYNFKLLHVANIFDRECLQNYVLIQYTLES